jgi:hypothetical protein
MLRTAPAVRVAPLGAVLAILTLAAPAAPQTPSRQQAPRHPRVCADGVRQYADVSQVATPYDSLVMPPGPPVQVTNPAEAEAAERTIRERAGSVGATGLVVNEVTEETAEGITVRRSVFPVFVVADSARAQAACRKRGAAPPR